MNGYAKVIGTILAATIVALLGGEGLKYARGDSQPPTAGAVRRNSEAIHLNADLDAKEHRELYLAQASIDKDIEYLKEVNSSMNDRLGKIETAQHQQALEEARRETKFDSRLEDIEKQNEQILDAIRRSNHGP